MKITNNTTTHQVAELMGNDASEKDGRIMMSLLSRDCVVDTDKLSVDAWQALMDEVCTIRRDEEDEQDAWSARQHAEMNAYWAEQDN